MGTDAGGWVSSGCPIFFSERGNKAKAESGVERGGNSVSEKGGSSVLDYIDFPKDFLPYVLHDLKEKVSYMK